jgi:CDP-glycerol glycerophosphotransferase (TagB/SpsB family)
MNVVTSATVGKKVLVAPTWGGSSTWMTLTSISLAPQLIDELIANDATVIFRPHPFSYRNEADQKIIKAVHETLAKDSQVSGRNHLYGEAAEAISSTEVINLADAMVSDMSGIVSDWLFSLKPFLLLNMDLDEKEFRKRYDIAWGGLQLSANSLSDLGESLRELMTTDKLYENRVKVREHYIGAAGDTDREKLFISAVHELIG